jgi:hypothetical protein
MLKTVLGLGIVAFVLTLTSCLPAEETAGFFKAEATAKADGPQRVFDLAPVVIVSRQGQAADGNPGLGYPKPAGDTGPEMADEDIPTDIIIATCDSDPVEVAVPLNAEDARFCDTVQVYPYRSDDNGAYAVSGADVEWDLPEQDVAYFAAPAYGPGGNVRRLAVGTDAFWASDKWDEPETLLTVCAKPPSHMPHAYLPICRSLPVRATVNLEGAWCFSGETFVGDCHDVEIRQDGRDVFIDDDVLADGRLWIRNLEFNRDNDYVYEGVLDSHDYMYGIVRLNGQAEVLGLWTAWKLPLY